jgi:hypothetical protein
VLASVSVVLAQGFPQPPANAMQLRFGAYFPAGGGEFWDETEDVFTLDSDDFRSFIFGISYVRSLTNRVELGFNLDFYSKTVRSSYRDFVDDRGREILHETRLELTPLTVDGRYLLNGRYRLRPGGRRVLKPVYYVGGGLGALFWRYEETGDFIDFTTDPSEIFPARFVEDGTAFEVHALAGLELPLGRPASFLLEGRLSAASTSLAGDFAGLGDIELGGASVYLGFAFRF